MRTARSKTPAPKDTIPFLKGRPDRTAPIGPDDVLNLLIALGLHADVSDLYEDPHIFDFAH